jgi:hypothetical protein
VTFIKDNDVPMLITMLVQRFIALLADIDRGCRMINTSPLLYLICPSLFMHPLGYHD